MAKEILKKVSILEIGIGTILSGISCSFLVMLFLMPTLVNDLNLSYQQIRYGSIFIGMIFGLLIFTRAEIIRVKKNMNHQLKMKTQLKEREYKIRKELESGLDSIEENKKSS